MATFNPWGGLVRLEEPARGFPPLSDPCWGWSSAEFGYDVWVEPSPLKVFVEDPFLDEAVPGGIVFSISTRRVS